MKIPLCCGKPMHIEMDTGAHLMVECEKCKDVVYLKKAVEKPELVELMG